VAARSALLAGSACGRCSDAVVQQALQAFHSALLAQHKLSSVLLLALPFLPDPHRSHLLASAAAALVIAAADAVAVAAVAAAGAHSCPPLQRPAPRVQYRLSSSPDFVFPCFLFAAVFSAQQGNNICKC
jgi:hypothetical protein